MYTQTNGYPGRECTYIYRLRRRKGHGNSSYPEVSREREISRDFVNYSCKLRKIWGHVPLEKLVDFYASGEHSLWLGSQTMFSGCPSTCACACAETRAFQFGQKDSILATESIFSIRFANLINLPLLHWYRYSNSNDGEFGEGPGGVSLRCGSFCAISVSIRQFPTS